MSVEFIWGVPKNTRAPRKTNVEKYPDTPVLTMLPTPEKGGGYKFELNKNLVEFLGLELNGEEMVSISVSPQDDTYVARLAVTTGVDVDQYLVKKNSSFSNKPIHQHMVKLMGLDGSLENEFIVKYENTSNDMKIYVLEFIAPIVEDEVVETEAELA